MDTFLFSGYARLPQDVSHQALYKRVGVVVEVDASGRIVAATSSLIMDLARDFFSRQVSGYNIITDRDGIEAELRLHYRGHSQGALISALRKIYEMVDQSPLVAGERVAASVEGSDGGHGV